MFQPTTALLLVLCLISSVILAPAGDTTTTPSLSRCTERIQIYQKELESNLQTLRLTQEQLIAFCKTFSTLPCEERIHSMYSGPLADLEAQLEELQTCQL